MTLLNTSSGLWGKDSEIFQHERFHVERCINSSEERITLLTCDVVLCVLASLVIFLSPKTFPTLM